MKRRNKWLFLTILPLAALASCATTYQKEGIFSNGYSDFRMKEDTFVVTYRANEHTRPEQVMRYALTRASELTVKHGYRYFTIIDQIDTSKERAVLDRKRDGRSERSTLSHLHYPSLRLTIQCFHDMPQSAHAIDARNFLNYNQT